jgi:hypothetical protein
VIVIQPPVEPWLARHFECNACGAIVQFETHDRGDSAFVMGPDGPTRARCRHCRTPFAKFTRVQEESIPMVDTSDDGLTLAPCVLCGRGYPTAEMWPRPDGFICDECSMKAPNDEQ